MFTGSKYRRNIIDKSCAHNIKERVVISRCYDPVDQHERPAALRKNILPVKAHVGKSNGAGLVLNKDPIHKDTDGNGDAPARNRGVFIRCFGGKRGNERAYLKCPFLILPRRVFCFIRAVKSIKTEVLL